MMLEPLKKAWSVVGVKSILPWVVMAFSAAYAFGKWEANVHAQVQQVAEIKSTSARDIREVREGVQRDVALMHQSVIERLEDLKDGQKDLDRKLDDTRKDLDRIKDDVRRMSHDSRRASPRD